MALRVNWDGIWGDVAEHMSRRSLCSRAQVGAVITDAHNRVVSTGYNGPPAGFEHSELPCKHWCPRMLEDGVHAPLEPCYSVHAEANALLSGDRSWWQGGTMYVTKHPCMECAKLIANSGLAQIVVSPNPPTIAEKRHIAVYHFLSECGVSFELIIPKMPATVLHLTARDDDSERD